MAEIKSVKDLSVYQKGYQLALRIYKTTRRFPKDERYGLTAQLRRAAVSIPSNIAEGHRRRSRNEYLQFLYIAYGSCGEVETQLDLSRDLGLIAGSDCMELDSLQAEVSKMLRSLIQALRQSNLSQSE